jgi:hypothetical protein
MEEAARQRRRKAEEAAELENQENARRQRDAPKEFAAQRSRFVTIIPRTSSGQRGFPRLWELTDAKEVKTQPDAERKIPEAKLHEEPAQNQFQQNFLGLVMISKGLRAFPSKDSWPAIVEDSCTIARSLLAQENRSRNQGTSSSLSLSPLELQFIRSIVALFERSGTTNVNDLRTWMLKHYYDIWADYFNTVLRVAGSAFSYSSPS